MDILTATMEHLDAMLAINNEAVPHVNGMSRPQFAELRRQAVVCRVATVQSAVVGFILALDHRATYPSENYQWFVSNLARFLYVDRIAVAPQHRGKGVGGALYRSLIADTRRLGLDVVACEVNLDPPNPLSLRFHKTLGFEQIGELRHMRDEKVVALLTWRPGIECPNKQIQPIAGKPGSS